ncbi:hypothetical protein GY45DRAFT_332966 [Cubamyces sp. BRFM 1775]|nr:hypothetical protein GY45DRAFT_332966 [Cubamyces sp. BRFM 1775]
MDRALSFLWLVGLLSCIYSPALARRLRATYHQLASGLPSLCKALVTQPLLRRPSPARVEALTHTAPFSASNTVLPCDLHAINYRYDVQPRVHRLLPPVHVIGPRAVATGWRTVMRPASFEGRDVGTCQIQLPSRILSSRCSHWRCTVHSTPLKAGGDGDCPHSPRHSPTPMPAYRSLYLEAFKYNPCLLIQLPIASQYPPPPLVTLNPSTHASSVLLSGLLATTLSTCNPAFASMYSRCFDSL